MSDPPTDGFAVANVRCLTSDLSVLVKARPPRQVAAMTEARCYIDKESGGPDPTSTLQFLFVKVEGN